MLRFITASVFFLSIVTLFVYCKPGLEAQVLEKTTVIASEKGLKDYYEDYFPIGVAVTPRIRGEEAALVIQHFNILNPENSINMVPINQ
ncbi:MAG: 1,4-beta-xylanase, partial [Segetibacter sp.]|nr:1,4-beta-xylanase [Segetibacter sp.]